MANHYMRPVAPLKIAALSGSGELARKVCRHIRELRGNDAEKSKSYLLKSFCPRLGTGEAKAVLQEPVRGTDLYILADVTSHNVTYPLYGYANHMSPDDHYQDLKRIIGASATAYRINIIIPFLYEGRQHRRNSRESLDCAMALKELAAMGVSSIITFDAHDPRIENAIPLGGFDNFMPTYQFIKTLFAHDHSLNIDKDHLMIISPDEGAMDRAVYLANHLSVNMGMFYKRRDYSQIVDGRNPIVAHEFLGTSLKGKTALIIDDMIASGESMLDTAKALKAQGAAKVIICCTFGLFTGGLEKFDEFYEKGYIDYVITTNLNHRPQDLLRRQWYLEADISEYTATIINSLNHNVPIGVTLDSREKIQRLVQKYQAGSQMITLH